MNGKKISIHICASAIAMVLVWCVRTFGKVDIPAEIGIAIGTIVAMLLIVVLPDRLIADEDGGPMTKQGGFGRVWFIPYVLFAAVLAIALTGCAAMSGLFEPLHKQPTAEQEAAETPAQKALRLAHETVDEANAALLSLNKTISDNIDNQVWTKAQAQSYLDQSVKFGKQVTRAREALRLGNLADAQSQAEAVRSLIILLQKKAADGARNSLLDLWPQYI